MLVKLPEHLTIVIKMQTQACSQFQSIEVLAPVI